MVNANRHLNVTLHGVTGNCTKQQSQHEIASHKSQSSGRYLPRDIITRERKWVSPHQIYPHKPTCGSPLFYYHDNPIYTERDWCCQPGGVSCPPFLSYNSICFIREWGISLLIRVFNWLTQTPLAITIMEKQTVHVSGVCVCVCVSLHVRVRLCWCVSVCNTA